MRQVKKNSSLPSKLAALKPVHVYRDERRVVLGTPFPALREMYTPNDLHYVLHRFSVPSLDVKKWKLRIYGKVERPIELNYNELLRMPSKTLTVTLECAGNGRALYDPPVSDVIIPWEHHGVSNAVWKGVPLASVLQIVKVQGSAKEVAFKGADHGIDNICGSEEEIYFERSLPLKKAMDTDTLLAYEMNGETLPKKHGFPLRLVVPGWYGMASVKWLTEIKVIENSFKGFYQADRYRYVYEWSDKPGNGTPVTKARVKSLITQPLEGEILKKGEIRVGGIAWGGDAKVKRVEISSDGGLTWDKARLVSRPTYYAWSRWEYLWKVSESGVFVLMARAVDELGNAQPFRARWNRQGLGNNSIHAINVWVS